MRLIYFLDHRFLRTLDGAVWTTNSYDAAFWSPYLSAFDGVTIVSRVREVQIKEDGWKRVDSDRVSVFCLPNYTGIFQYMLRFLKLKRLIREVLKQPGAVIARAPSQLANSAYRELILQKRPYAVENVGDSSAALKRGVTDVKFRPLLQHYFTASQTKLCKSSVACSYVAKFLAEKYPPAAGSHELICSDVRIEGGWIRATSRTFDLGAVRILTVATFTQHYKGLDVLLEAIAVCRDLGLPVTLTLVGEGRLRQSLEAQAHRLGLSSSVFFRGSIAWGPELIAEYDRADLFVLPSRIEALPRALVEAMARALPCIGTDVGAVSELLDDRWIAKPGDAIGLASRIFELASNPHLLNAQSHRNLYVAEGFAASRLRPRWEAFYKQIAEITATHDEHVLTTSPEIEFLEREA